MMKKLVIIIILIIFCGCCYGNDKLKEVHTFLKAKNYANAAASIEKCKKDSSMMNDPALYVLAADVQKKLNDQQNMKLYLKQAYDTVAFFSTIYGIYTNLMRCYELDNVPNEKGKVKAQYNGLVKKTFKRYYPNIYNAGLFHMKKKQYAEADKYFSLYINLIDHPLFNGENLKKKDGKLPRGAFWSMASCYSLNKYEEVFKFEDLAMRDTANIGLCIQYKAMSYAALKKYPEMVKELKRGMREQSGDLFFFSHLTDYYNSVKDFDSSMALCDSLIRMDSTIILYKFAKSVIYFNRKEYDKCIDLSKWVISKDESNIDAYYYIASSYYNLATKMEDEISPDINSNIYREQKHLVKSLYENALTYMEHYRKLRPDDMNRWGAPLYRIYLALNMGKQFTEMEGILKKIEEEKKAAAAKANGGKK